MATKVVSLAYYADRAKRTGVSHDDFRNGGEYLDFLPSKVDLEKVADLWANMFDPEDTLVPLNEIDLPQTDYLDVVDQLFRGVSFQNVRIAAVNTVPRPAHSPYYPKYLANIGDDSRTGVAVDATLSRLNEVIDTRAVATARGNGLVVGRVQSGKTRNYIGVILKAVDEGWNVVIVLTSAIKSLAQQTRKRIKEEFAAVGADNRQHVQELDFLSTTMANERAGDELNGDFFYWGVSMKQKDGLERIRRWLEITNQPHASMRVLIIDDESDSATPDSNAKGSDNLDDEGITERIEAIRRDGRFSELAEWLDSLREREWPDIGAKTPEAETFGQICDLLNGNLSKKQKRDSIVNSADFRRLLGMDDFSSPPVEKLITQFFHSTSGGNSDETCGAFVLLLKSIIDLERERSAINAAICHLVGPNPETGSYAYPFGRCAYLGYTATPYANILNEGPGHTPLYADFIQSLDIPPQYFGAEAIFGHDIAQLEPHMPIVQPITDDDVEQVLNPLRENAGFSLDTDLMTSKGYEWTSMKEAVAWSFCSAAARRHARRRIADEKKRELLANRWTTLIVNLHHERSLHTRVKNILNGFIEARCSTPAGKAVFAEYCHEIWEKQIATLTLDDFNRLFNNPDMEPGRQYGGINGYPDWNDIAPELMFFLDNWERQVHSIEMNSTPDGVANQALYAQSPEAIAAKEVKELPDDNLWLVSGGNTIGRGLTLEGLVCSYFDRVRKSTCVDTLTQMGRWFGYRRGYELLPRLWMQGDTVVEMKRIAMTELRLHESIADNFEQKFSPADPAHFQQIYCWGRKLSGRARASRPLDSPIGTTASADDFPASPEKRRDAFDVCSKFIEDLGPQFVRDPGEYLYASTPLWEDVDRDEVRKLLERLLRCYPERSRKTLRGIIREINCNDPVNWDVVIGNPSRGFKGKPIRFGGVEVGFGSPKATPFGKDVIRTVNARLHISFYAMIRSEYIFREDLALLKMWSETVSESIDRRRIQNDGVLPRQYDEALPGATDDPVFMRVQQLIMELEEADGAKPLPEAIHARLGDASMGFRNRSSAEYMANVHRSANHLRPVLQFYLLRPKGLADDANPLVNISFYWPGHDPDIFFNVSVSEIPDNPPLVTPRVFCQNVEDILRERDFPMQRKELLRALLEKLGARCSEAFFDARIARPLDGYTYHKMKGRNAYCIDGWAVDEEQRLASEFLQAAIGVLQRERTPFETEDLIRQVVDEQPRFRDFFVPGNDNTLFNNLMTDEILNANDITLTCRRPVTYQYHA